MMKQPPPGNGTSREIRFVLPRRQQNGKKQFIFQGQHKQLVVVKDVPYQQTKDDHTKSKAAPTNKIQKVDDDKELQWLLKSTNDTPEKKTKKKESRIESDIATTPKLKRTLSDTIEDILSTKKKKSKKARKLERRREKIEQLDSEKTKSFDEKQQHEESSVTEKIKQAQKLIETSTNQQQKQQQQRIASVEEISTTTERIRFHVKDAMKDKVGGRPRSNSTDGELNLPQRGLCDESMILRSVNWDMNRLYNIKSSSSPTMATNSLPPPRGFINLGNTCFLNATLQCLAYMPPFCQSIVALPTSCYNNTQSHGGQTMTMLLRSVMRVKHGILALEKGEPPKTVPMIIKKLHKEITSRKINGHRFRHGRQEDAHELLVQLLDYMHEGELIAAGINPQASGWRDKLPIPRLDETTFIHRIFGGYFRSQLKCNKCGYKSNTYDPFLDLALEVSKKHIDSLTAAFREFTQKETLDSNNRWKCSGCKNHVCPTKHLSIFRPPLSLCIHLKRFEFEAGGSFNLNGWGKGWGFGHRNSKGLSMGGNGGSKISKKIHFPLHLSLPLSDGRICQYYLTGVIIHVGNSATSGHYTSYVKQPGGTNKWCYMDDSYVEMVPESTVLKQKDAYVLFYTRKEVGQKQHNNMGKNKKKRKRKSSPF